MMAGRRPDRGAGASGSPRPPECRTSGPGSRRATSCHRARSRRRRPCRAGIRTASDGVSSSATRTQESPVRSEPVDGRLPSPRLLFRIRCDVVGSEARRGRGRGRAGPVRRAASPSATTSTAHSAFTLSTRISSRSDRGRTGPEEEGVRLEDRGVLLAEASPWPAISPISGSRTRRRDEGASRLGRPPRNRGHAGGRVGANDQTAAPTAIPATRQSRGKRKRPLHEPRL